MYWMDMSAPIRFMPFVSEAITKAPMIDPVTLPTPPATATPPTKAAAMASNSMPVPAIVVADRNQDAYRMPDTAVSRPIEPKTKIGDLLDTDAVQLSRLWISADSVDMPADYRPGGDVGIDEDHDQQDHCSPGETLVSGEHPGDAGDHSRHEYQLEDEHVHRQHFKVVGLRLSAVADFASDEQNDGQ